MFLVISEVPVDPSPYVVTGKRSRIEHHRLGIAENLEQRINITMTHPSQPEPLGLNDGSVRCVCHASTICNRTTLVRPRAGCASKQPPTPVRKATSLGSITGCDVGRS